MQIMINDQPWKLTQRKEMKAIAEMGGGGGKLGFVRLLVPVEDSAEINECPCL